MGLEIELNLAGADGLPRMMNSQVLERIASRDFQTELAQCNLEVNILPHRLTGRVLDQLAEELRTGLAYADRKAREVAARIVMIGILPTLHATDLTAASLSETDRYALLNDQMRAARGEDFALDIQGVEHLVSRSPSIAPEAACTSVQLHLQVTPGRFAAVWNAAQAIAAVQVAVGANSPFLFGRELWRESRPPVFQQATDTRVARTPGPGRAPPHLVRRALDRLRLRPLRGEPALLPAAAADLRAAGAAAGARRGRGARPGRTGAAQRHGLPLEPPRLRGRRRCRRTCGSRTGCCRPGPPSPTSSPTPPSTTAWCGRWPRSRAPSGRGCPFAAAARELRHRLPVRHRRHLATGRVPDGPAASPRSRPLRLVRQELLPLAAAGLDAWGVEPADRDHYLGIIEERCRRRVNGASWQAAAFHHARRQGLDRDAALAAMTRRYSELMHTGEPVHTWPVAWPVTGRAAVPEAWEAAAEGA